jgi:hypothetical protein
MAKTYASAITQVPCPWSDDCFQCANLVLKTFSGFWLDWFEYTLKYSLYKSLYCRATAHQSTDMSSQRLRHWCSKISQNYTKNWRTLEFQLNSLFTNLLSVFMQAFSVLSWFLDYGMWSFSNSVQERFRRGNEVCGTSSPQHTLSSEKNKTWSCRHRPATIFWRLINLRGIWCTILPLLSSR